MNIQTIFIFLFLFAFATTGQNNNPALNLVTIQGYAPKYVGQTISIMQIDDYFSMKENLLGKTTVLQDSTFSVSFYANDIQKVNVRAAKNSSFMYIQPNATYDIYVPEKDPYEAYRPNGNKIELSFFGLDSTDINYKILKFQRWADEFMSTIFYLKNTKPQEFIREIDAYKRTVEETYASDTSVFFKTYVRFSIAAYDNIQANTERNRYDKYDFYIRNTPVFYQNDAYMSYIKSFYSKMLTEVSNETNSKVYSAVLKSSPTLLMHALGAEYTLNNLRIREMVMIKMLSEEFYSKDFPQTNIVTIMDSLSKQCLFKANTGIAQNILARITELTTGGKAPDFALRIPGGELITLRSFTGKHLYLHFLDPKSIKAQNEIGPLIQIYERYKEDVQFLTLYVDEEYDEKTLQASLNAIPWRKVAVENTNTLWKNYKIETFPQYILLDGFGYVVSAPALGPLPNGQYETIDHIFFSIRKAKKLEEERR
jgi:hypothetical protein